MATEKKVQTVREWLEELAARNTSTEIDEYNMGTLLHKAGFPQAKIVAGIVYLEGKGTVETPPVDIHSVARMILKAGGGK